MTAPLWSQEGFRFRSDVTGVVWLETELDDHSHTIGENFRLRFELENTNAKAAVNNTFELWASRNSGAYEVVTTSSTYIIVSPSSEFADGDADSVDRLTTSGAVLAAGELDENGEWGAGGILDNAASEKLEVEVCLQITASSSVSDTFDFEIRNIDDTQINNYSYRPKVTALIGDPNVSESDPISVTDTPSLDPLVLPNLSESDAVTVTDTPTVSVVDPVSATVAQMIGFETGGLEEAMATSGSPLVDATRVRSGTYSLRFNASASYQIDPDPLGLLSDDTYGYMVEFWINFDTLAPSADYGFMSCTSDYPTNANWAWYLRLNTDGKFSFFDVGTELIVDATGLTVDTWHKFQIYWEWSDGSGDWAVYLDDVSKGSGSAMDSITGVDPSFYGDGSYRFRHDGSTMVDYFVDDFVHKVFCSGISDRYSDLWKISTGYQNTLENNLDQGSTLDDGQWLDASELPFVDDASPNLASYTAQNDDGHMRTDEGTRSGPASDIDGTPIAAKWIWRVEGNEAVSDLEVRYGRYDSGVGDTTTTTTPTAAGLAAANVEFISEDSDYVPQDTSEYFCIGFKNTDATAEIYLHEGIAFLLQTYTEEPSIDEQDAVTVSDTPSVSPLTIPDLSESDAVTVSDSPTLNIYLEIVESEAVTVGDSASLDPLDLGSVEEADAVSVGESPTLSIAIPGLVESDAVTVIDTPAVERVDISDLSISEADPVTVGESQTLNLELTDIVESDAVTVGDTPVVSVISILDLSISEADPVSIADNATIDPLSLGDVAESDAVTVTDTPIVSVVSISDLTINVSDAVTVSDNPIFESFDLSVDVSDPVTVSDLPSFDALGVQVSESEAVSVVDLAGLYLPVEISESEAVSVGDSELLSLPLSDVIVSDAITVAENVDLSGLLEVFLAYMNFTFDKREIDFGFDKRELDFTYDKREINIFLED